MNNNKIKFIRAATRITALAFISVVAAFAYLSANFFFRSSRKRNLQSRATKFWARNIAKVVRLKIKTEGTPPATPFFLVSNHLSYVDIIVLMTLLDCIFVAKSDVADWFGIGNLAKMVGTIFIDREQNRSILPALEKIDDALKNKIGVIVFAEGTSTKGETVLPFKPSLLEIAVRKSLNVNYASLSYSTPEGCTPASLSVCWWGDMTFQDHAWRLCQLPEIEVAVRFGEGTIKDEDRKELAKKLLSAVSKQFVPTV
jgi:1-acyl-sn-glycerol-3-phosphate acyltransferase